ncbi:EXS family-domain-containing protein, partial [Mrakia frigida]|uniref:EXS domain-containing protein n=1 Tax=Mrakia frigida TaxID=29902 RepID=UPI003FCC1E66
DELNSLVFSIFNIWFLACAQNCSWDDVYGHCNQYESWVPAVLSCLPALSRLLQCVQRWRDSGLQLHLINAGKYASTIVTAITFFFWRSRGNSISDVTFPLWVVSASVTSIYSCSWDFVIDWSVLDPNNKFLRKDLLYKDHPVVYYFALVSNLLIRCIWVGYIPQGGLNIRVRAFIFYAFEMLRRFQWNFFRVENEQIGNIDAYRITRELPLPYELQGLHDGDSSGSEGEERESKAAKASGTREGSGVKLSRMLSRRSSTLVRRMSGVGGVGVDEEQRVGGRDRDD